MSSIEIEAKTIQEAVDKACKHFNVQEEDLEIKILENKSVGIFGIVGNKKVKIQAKPKENNLVTIALETLNKITSPISVDTKISAEKKGDNIMLNIKGDNPSILIGHKGKTLEALEFIVNKVVNKSSNKKVKVIVDSENYRQKRENSLRELAFKMSEKAKKTKKTVTINPINPYERRIIHMALREEQGVQTKSRGRGLLKKISIIPEESVH